MPIEEEARDKITYTIKVYQTREAQEEERLKNKPIAKKQLFRFAVAPGCTVTAVDGLKLFDGQEVTLIHAGGRKIDLDALVRVGAVLECPEPQWLINTDDPSVTHIATVALTTRINRIVDKGEPFPANAMARAPDPPNTKYIPGMGTVEAGAFDPGSDGKSELEALVLKGWVKERKRAATVAAAIRKVRGGK